jgi:hypothetical protein
MKRTVEVVPSPLMSSCATAVLAIIIAVGFWICCIATINNVLPSPFPSKHNHRDIEYDVVTVTWILKTTLTC